MPSSPNVPTMSMAGSLVLVIWNWRFEIGQGGVRDAVIVPDVSVTPPHCRPENVYTISVMPSALALTVNSNDIPVVEAFQTPDAMACGPVGPSPQAASEKVTRHNGTISSASLRIPTPTEHLGRLGAQSRRREGVSLGGGRPSGRRGVWHPGQETVAQGRDWDGLLQGQERSGFAKDPWRERNGSETELSGADQALHGYSVPVISTLSEAHLQDTTRACPRRGRVRPPERLEHRQALTRNRILVPEPSDYPGEAFLDGFERTLTAVATWLGANV
jgi:hypothetical protein